jgi:hypothetical protein
MGYTTRFSGQFKIEPPLSEEHRDELLDLARVGCREPGSPGGYVQWEPTEDGKALRWDQGEKFYDYTEWLQFLIDSRLGPWGHTVSGAVAWAGEEVGDNGVLTVEGNKVVEHKACKDVVAVYVPAALIERHIAHGDAAKEIAEAVVKSAKATGAFRHVGR